MLRTDIANRVVYLTRPIIQRNRMSNTSFRNACPVDKRSGMPRMQGGKIKYGVNYTAELLKYFEGRTKIKGGNKFWKIVVLDAGKGSVPETKSRGWVRPKRPVMGRIHHHFTHSKYPGLAQSRFLRQGKESNKARVARILFK